MIRGLMRMPFEVLYTGVFYLRHREEVHEFFEETRGCSDCDGLDVCDRHLVEAYGRWFT